MLDRTNTHPGYLLGRLFAVLERLQEEAAGGGGNLKKLPWVKREWFEKLVGEILAALHDIPRQLPLPDQGRFALGYYHQRQDFFTKKTDDTTTNATTASLEGTTA